MLLKNINVCTVHKNNYNIINADGEVLTLNQAKAHLFFLNAKQPILLCHRTSILKKLELEHLSPEKVIDILELWAFVKPSVFTVPTPSTIAQNLNIDNTNESNSLLKSAEKLIDEIKSEAGRPYLENMIASMTKTGWGWGEFLMQSLNLNMKDFHKKSPSEGFDVWNRVKKWEPRPPPPPAGNKPITNDEVIEQIRKLLPDNNEERSEQFEYSKSLTDSFNPNDDDKPTITLAEGGTGVGKTIGYLAPASIWAKKNEAPVWISTYTRNLQHQIYDEVKKLYPNEKDLYDKVVICKGRENYICITKFKLAVAKATTNKGWHIALGIIARWLEVSKNGDIQGNDFPSWLNEIIDPHNKILRLLVVKRDFGETHSHCQYTDSCFVDQAIKRAPYADIVITNHAFLLFNSRVGFISESQIKHIVFDEGHHLFDASDSAFGSFLSVSEGEFMRRFIIKNENGDLLNEGGASGLKSILTDVLGSDTTAQENLDKLLEHAKILPDSHWQNRFDAGNPMGDGEKFFLELTKFIMGNTKPSNYDTELDTSYIPNHIIELAQYYATELEGMVKPTTTLLNLCEEKLSTSMADMDKTERKKLINALKTLEFRILDPIQVWVDMLKRLNPEYENEKIDYSNILDVLCITKQNGTQHDVGIKRHFVNPIKEFAKTVYPQITGTVITSATLLDSTEDENKNWDWAELKTGTNNVVDATINKKQVKSPFNYKEKTKVIVVNDVEKNNTAMLSSSYYSLFKASGGSALGLFSNISRLKQVYKNIYEQMIEQDINLYAQHIDNMTTATLVNVFKHDINSCLLGTNAVRDGVDIPGNSLKLLVMDRIPWQVPDEIHKSRRKEFKDFDYDKSIVRAKIKQAFGRLIRNKQDYGIFVILDTLPSNLKSAFPDDCEVITCGINDAVKYIAENLEKLG
ncbi:MAG: ATP-dependent DNA helicase [Alphaproteobacteria bacterium]